MLKWYDSKSVVLVTNCVKSGTPDTVRRWNKNKKIYEKVDRQKLFETITLQWEVLINTTCLLVYFELIKSNKWTLRLITHAFDMATTNSWLEYRIDANNLGVEKKNQLDLLQFKERLGEELITVGKVSQISPSTLGIKRGRPRNNSTLGSPAPPAKKFLRLDNLPNETMKLDHVGHYPKKDNKKHPLFCKRQGCKLKSHWVCTKCNVHLCMTSSNNCFLKFHHE